MINNTQYSHLQIKTEKYKQNSSQHLWKHRVIAALTTAVALTALTFYGSLMVNIHLYVGKAALKTLNSFSQLSIHDLFHNALLPSLILLCIDSIACKNLFYIYNYHNYRAPKTIERADQFVKNFQVAQPKTHKGFDIEELHDMGLINEDTRYLMTMLKRVKPNASSENIERLKNLWDAYKQHLADENAEEPFSNINDLKILIRSSQTPEPSSNHSAWSLGIPLTIALGTILL